MSRIEIDAERRARNGLAVDNPAACRACDGTGRLATSPEGYEDDDPICADCRGTGRRAAAPAARGPVTCIVNVICDADPRAPGCLGSRSLGSARLVETGGLTPAEIRRFYDGLRADGWLIEAGRHRCPVCRCWTPPAAPPDTFVVPVYGAERGE